MLSPSRWLCALALVVPAACAAAEPAKVFPVQAFFYDATQDSKLDPVFRDYVHQQSAAALGKRIHDALIAAFGARVGRLDQRTAGNTFAVSVHVTRANSFVVDKGNGNKDVIATLTGSVYFTHVISGEILTTVTRTVVSRAVVGRQSDLATERRGLFRQALDTLLQDLTTEAPRQFQPVVIETRLTDKVGELLVFDVGYRQGIVVGDRIEDSVDNLVEIVYSADSYSVGRLVVGGNFNIGDAFQKFSAHAASGKDRPRVAVLVDLLPPGYGKDYIARLFSEILGDGAALSVVQINTGFTEMLRTVREQDGVELSAMRASERRPPNLLVRLRVTDTLFHESGTNLEFERQRRYETRAFADVIDASGRVIFSAVGADVIKDRIVRGIGPGLDERREVSIKNALTDLSKKFEQLGELKRDRTEIIAVNGSGFQINPQGRSYSERQQGVILRKASARFGKDRRDIFLPRLEAAVTNFAEQKSTSLVAGLPIDPRNEAVAVGDLFEVLRLGNSSRSAASLSACGPIESLGNIRTPFLMEMMSAALGKQMPGVLYAVDAKPLTDGVIGPFSGFTSEFPWNLASVAYCIQPVERVNVGDEQCAEQCDRPIQIRYTLRVKKGSEIVSRIGFEAQIKSTGYYRNSTPPEHVKRIVDADVLDEAGGLLDKVVEKISFPSANR